MADTPFDYGLAFGRTVGWIGRAEQSALRGKRVAVAGMGGVGGAHLVTLARLGVERFHACDPDVFELSNFNRAVGASLSNLGRRKVEVVTERARDINPGVEVRVFEGAIGPGNVDAFLEGVDLFIDSLDLFALEARRLCFARCAARALPALTAAPLGMGCALLYFRPGGMTFERYFRLEGHPPDEQLLRFLVGVAPAILQRSYILDATGMTLEERRAPSTPMGIALAAGVAATAALKILLRRGPLLAAPWGMQFDAYRNRLKRTWRPFGNANPWQRLMISFARRALRRRRSLPGAEPPALAAPGDRTPGA